MKTNLYLNNETLVAGITLRDASELECNNMALHAAANSNNVLKNLEKLARSVQCSLDDFVCANQTHSANFHRVTLADKGRGATQLDTAIKDTDALYTYEPNILLCSFTADCVPVTFYNEKAGLIGVIHSGWQGTVKEITLKLFTHLIQTENCQPQNFTIHIGTALSQQKFEVDEDVYVKFKALGYAEDFMYFNEETSKYHIDNRRTVKKQCELAGIPSDCITIDPTCTFLNEDGFSYRQNKKAGRHLSFIMRKG
ncbi:peptidoglycan editing factor PgeF [Lysinibacillus sp. 54212]|uniref:peptidoglycan editing factor PgeF n=1 Tax=Lysinibacillus sp. 54212 TaxID=3119829 RepID=UPI002FC58726